MQFIKLLKKPEKIKIRYKNLEESAISKEIINISVGNYEEFLQKIRILMANKIKEYFNKL